MPTLKRGLAPLIALVAACALCSPGFADEGLWPLDRLEELDQELLKARGMNVGPAEIRELAGAVVKLRTRGSRAGATGSFVSESGLILTNHHVAYGCIVDNSTTDDDLLAEGFVATSRAEERPCPGLEALVPRAMRVVDEDESERLLAECSERPGRACEIAHEVPSGRVQLVEYAVVGDVRLVHAPEQSFASFGGAIDNFEWPRHSADYTILRGYSGPKGEARQHDPTNVPYRPLQILRPARIGVTRGDVVFSMGYPYKTSRYRPAPELRTLAETLLGERVALDETLATLARRHSAADQGNAIALASLLARYENRLKLHRALVRGIARTGALEQRELEARRVGAWAAADEAMGAEIVEAMRVLEELEPSPAIAGRDELIARAELFRSLTWALSIAERAHQLSLPETERDARFRGSALEALDAGIRDDAARAVPGFEAEALAHFVRLALELPEGARIDAVETRVERPFESAGRESARLASGIMGSTRLLESEGRVAAMALDPAALGKTRDGLLAFALDLDAERRALKEARGAREEKRERALSAWYRALTASLALPLAPDANGTLRFSHGQVRGYAPPGRGSRFGFATTAASMVAANAGEAPHALPKRVLAQLSGRKLPYFVDPVLGDLPVNFVATLDGIGGSSGSPVLDARGQLVGLVFDLNHEAAANDTAFDPVYGRAIAVDIRFILDTLLRVYGAVELVQEMGVGE
jgi:hypothetical protein